MPHGERTWKVKDSKWKLTQQVASNIIVVFAGIAFFLALSNFDAVRAQLASWMGIVSPFIGGIVIAYLLDGPVRFFEKQFGGRRKLAVVLAYALALVVVSFLISMVVPQIVESLMLLMNRVPGYLDNLDQMVRSSSLNAQGLEELIGSYQELLQKATSLLSALLPKVVGYGMAIGSGVVGAITALISSIYMLVSKERLLRQLRKAALALLPLDVSRRVLDVCSHANRVFSSFINGKIIDSSIIGVICFVAMALLRLPFAVLISVIVGGTNIIPFFGPFIGAIPSIVILLIVDPFSALKFTILVIVLQQFDGNILGPKILGNSTGLSALWVLVAIIVGGGLFGFTGMVVGVPVFAVLYSLVSSFFARRLREKGIDETGRPLDPPPEGPAPDGQSPGQP